MKIYGKNSGLSLLEVTIVVLMFSLFMFVIYSTIDVGLKMWKLGEVHSDVESKSESVVRRMVMELKNANSYAVVVNQTTDPNEPYYSTVPYICFETPFHNGEAKYKENTGNILWQGFILYYALADEKDPALLNLYRRYIPHSSTYPYYSDDCLNPQLADPASINTWILDRPPMSLPEGQALSFSTRLVDADFEYSASLVKLKFEFQGKVKRSENSKVMVTGRDSTYKFSVETSVKPQN